MEDWQQEQACYETGDYDEGPEAFLMRLEEQYTAGELSADDIIQIRYDLIHIKEHQLKPNNLLNVVLKDKDETRHKTLMYKLCINSLTSAVATNLMIDINQRRREDPSQLDELPPSENAGSIPSQNGEPTLDERNRLDHKRESSENNRKMTEEAGHETPARPHLIAEICDGIRNDLYDEMAGFVEGLEDNHALYRHVQKTPPNYNQPMGLDFNLEFRMKNAGRIDEVRAGQIATEDNEDVEFIREVMKQDSLRLAQNLKAIAPEVVKEAEGFTTSFTRDEFVDLPIDMQIRIGNKLANSLNNEYKRLYGVRIRTADLEVQDQMTMIKASRVLVKKWIEDATILMNKQSQSTRDSN